MGGGASPLYRAWRKVAVLLPSAITLSALLCGISAIPLAFLGQVGHAVKILWWSAALDAIDGHVARYLEAVTPLGGELDSLCDLVDFGVAPGIVMYAWATQTFKAEDIWTDGMLWAFCCVSATACAFRLARYNLQHAIKPVAGAAPAHTHVDVPPVADPATTPSRYGLRTRKPAETPSQATTPAPAAAEQQPKEMRTVFFGIFFATKEKFHCGVPAPIGGAFVLLPLVCYLYFGSFGPLTLSPRAIVALNYVWSSVLMVSELPTLSSKMLMKDPAKESHLRSKNTRNFILKMIALPIFVYACVRYTFFMFITLCAMYLGFIPFSFTLYHAMRQ